MTTIRIGNGLYTDSFLNAHKGEKIIFYPQEQGEPRVAPEDKDGLMHALRYEWEYTPTAEIDLGDNNIVKTGSDGDYLRLYNEDVSIFFGRSFGGYVVLDLRFIVGNFYMVKTASGSDTMKLIAIKGDKYIFKTYNSFGYKNGSTKPFKVTTTIENIIPIFNLIN
jgi:hypothetical protein